MKYLILIVWLCWIFWVCLREAQVLVKCEQMEKYKGFTSGEKGKRYEIPRPFATID